MLVRGRSARDYLDSRPRIHRQRGRFVPGSVETQQEGHSPTKLTERQRRDPAGGTQPSQAHGEAAQRLT